MKLTAALILVVGLLLADRQLDFSTLPDHVDALLERVFPRRAQPHENLGY